jgi:hypothetical protein
MDQMTNFSLYTLRYGKNFNVPPNFISISESSCSVQMTIMWSVTAATKIHELSFSGA